MSTPTPHVRYTMAEYLALEAHANVRHEFLDGVIYALAGGTPEHGAIVMRVGAALVEQLRGKRCNVYSSDVRVRVVATGLTTYPDLSIVCGTEERDAEDRLALVNPVVLIEVTSASTEAYDRGEKPDNYCKIPSLQEVVFVSHREPKIEVRRRDADDWTSASAGPGQAASLWSIDCRLDVDDIYRDPLAGS